MKFSEQYQSCGHKDTAYTYNLNLGKVSALRKLIDRYELTKAPVQLGDMGITNSQYTNFCHLAYFGLAKHITEGWIPTELGIAFIYGEAGVQVPVAVLNGRVLEASHPAWETHTKTPETKYVFDINNTAYKKRGEYQEEIAHLP